MFWCRKRTNDGFSGGVMLTRKRGRPKFFEVHPLDRDWVRTINQCFWEWGWKGELQTDGVAILSHPVLGVKGEASGESGGDSWVERRVKLDKRLLEALVSNPDPNIFMRAIISSYFASVSEFIRRETPGFVEVADKKVSRKRVQRMRKRRERSLEKDLEELNEEW